jgi:hypothetical protein
VVNWGGKLWVGKLATPIGGWKFDKVLVLFFEARGHCITIVLKVISEGLK